MIIRKADNLSGSIESVVLTIVLLTKYDLSFILQFKTIDFRPGNVMISTEVIQRVFSDLTSSFMTNKAK